MSQNKEFLLSTNFVNHIGVSDIHAEFGSRGISILLILLCEIFKNGGSIVLTPLNNTIREFAAKQEVELSTVWRIIHRAVLYGIFVKKDFAKGVIRPSKRIAKQITE